MQMDTQTMRAIVYMEWKTNRNWWLLGFLLQAALTISYGLQTLFAAPSGTLAQRFIWHALYPILYGIQYTSTAGSAGYPQHADLAVAPGLFVFNALVALGLGITLITRDRNRGSLYYAWTLPLPRTAVYSVKWLGGFAVVLAAALVNTAYLIIGDLSTGAGVPLSEVWYWSAINTLLPLFAYAIGSLVGTLVNSGASAFLLAAPSLAAPLGVGSVLIRAVSPFYTWSPSAAASTLAGQWAIGLQRLSPFYYITQVNGISSSQTMGHIVTQIAYNGTEPQLGWTGLLFLLAIPLLFVLGRRFYARAMVERYTDLFLFPSLWYIAIIVVSLAIGVVLAQFAALATGGSFLLFMLLFAGVNSLLLIGGRRLFTR